MHYPFLPPPPWAGAISNGHQLDSVFLFMSVVMSLALVVSGLAYLILIALFKQVTPSLKNVKDIRLGFATVAVGLIVGILGEYAMMLFLVAFSAAAVWAILWSGYTWYVNRGVQAVPTP